MLILLSLLMVLLPASREKFDHAVEYIGWQAIDAYMKDYTNLRPDRTAEKEGYEVFKQQFPAAEYSIENPPESEAVKQVLTSNNWSNAYKSLYNRIINLKSMYNESWSDQEAAGYLRNQIENINLKSLGVDDSAYVNLQITKAQLKDEIARFYSIVREKEPVVAEPEADMPIKGETGEEEMIEEELANTDTETPMGLPQVQTFFSNVQKSQWGLTYQVNIISLFLILILLGLLLYLFNMYKKMDERLDRHRKEINEINSDIFVLKRKAGEEKEAKLAGRVDALENRVRKLVQEYATEIPVTAPTDGDFQKLQEEEPEQHEFYLSTPNSDGTFNVSSMTPTYKPTASIYKFSITREDEQSIAAFTVAEQYESIKDALSSPGSYLDPVCESVNAFSPLAKKIRNIRPGRAIREGDKWVVRPEDKAIIRYE